MINRHCKSSLLFFFSWILLTYCASDPDPKILPEIVSVTPDTGSFAMSVTIGGNNFGAVKDDNVVKFNGVEAQIYEISKAAPTNPFQTELKVLVPAGAGTGPVSLTTEGKTVTGPIFTYVVPEKTNYYISFKVDGVLKEFYENDPGYYHCTVCSCESMTAENGDDVIFSVCREDHVTSQMILDLKGKKLNLRDNGGYPYAEFTYSTGLKYYSSGALNNLYSFMTITDVAYHSSTHGSNAYNVSGTFEGLFEDPNDLSTISVTEGKFLIRFTSTVPG